MKKEYIFAGLIITLLYVSYLVLHHTYEDYKRKASLEKLGEMTKQLELQIEIAQEFISYISTPAYRNKVIKEEEGLKNKGEKVVSLITEQNYEKYTKTQEKKSIEETIQSFSEEENLINTMSIYEKWTYLLFKKDIRG